MSEGKFSYSFDEERFNGSFETREDALNAAISQNEDDSETIWTGLNYTPARCVCAESVIYDVACNTTDESGDWSDGYLSKIPQSAIDSLQKRLQGVWDEWEKEHSLEPSWFNVRSVKEHSAKPQGSDPTGLAAHACGHGRKEAV